MALAHQACRRCNGDLFLEDDLFTIDVVCLQCGLRRSLERRQLRELSRARAAA